METDTSSFTRGICLRARTLIARTFTLPLEGEVIRHQGCSDYLGKHIGEGSWGAVFHCTDDWEYELVPNKDPIVVFKIGDLGITNFETDLKSVYSPAIAKALRRHMENRTQTSLDFWKDIASARPK